MANQQPVSSYGNHRKYHYHTTPWTAQHINPEFRNLIAQRRNDLGMTQFDLAGRMQCSQATVSYLETKRKVFLQPDKFWLLYEALEFDPTVDPPDLLFNWAYNYDIKEV